MPGRGAALRANGREIAAEVEQLRIPHARLVLGVGTGAGSSLAACAMRSPSCAGCSPIVRLGIAALGPRMCALGGEIADVVLLNWSFPDRIAWSRERIADGSCCRQRADAARGRLRARGDRRGCAGDDSPPRGSDTATDRAPTPASSTRRTPRERGVPGVAAVDPTEVPALLAPYRAALDSCVVRALAAEPGADGWLEIAAAATLRA